MDCKASGVDLDCQRAAYDSVFFGIVNTRVNYDLLSYLPEHLETVKGQDILVDEYGMGAFSMVVVEDMELKDVQKLEEKFSEVPHVKDVLWYDDAADISLPVEMLPKDIREAFFKGEATMMLALFDNTTLRTRQWMR